jgi:hypothetical protein
MGGNCTIRTRAPWQSTPGVQFSGRRTAALKPANAGLTVHSTTGVAGSNAISFDVPATCIFVVLSVTGNCTLLPAVPLAEPTLNDTAYPPAADRSSPPAAAMQTSALSPRHILMVPISS